MSDITADPVRFEDSYPKVPVEAGMPLLHRASGVRGRFERLAGDFVELADSKGRRHRFRNRPGAFALRGETVSLTAPAAAGAPPRLRRSAAGALMAQVTAARVARASRIWVEGDHDAALLERVWGDDLRELGIVVEPLGGLDGIEAALGEFRPGPGRIVVVLVDHLVEGSKEHRIARAVASEHVHVVGHPFVDIWQCVRPAALGIAAWPEVPRGEDWKSGICRRLGWGDPRDGWQRVLSVVDSFAQIDPALVGAVEEALDLLERAR